MHKQSTKIEDEDLDSNTDDEDANDFTDPEIKFKRDFKKDLKNLLQILKKSDVSIFLLLFI